MTRLCVCVRLAGRVCVLFASLIAVPAATFGRLQYLMRSPFVCVLRIILPLCASRCLARILTLGRCETFMSCQQILIYRKGIFVLFLFVVYTAAAAPAKGATRNDINTSYASYGDCIVRTQVFIESMIVVCVYFFVVVRPLFLVMRVCSIALPFHLSDATPTPRYIDHMCAHYAYDTAGLLLAPPPKQVSSCDTHKI